MTDVRSDRACWMQTPPSVHPARRGFSTQGKGGSPGLRLTQVKLSRSGPSR
jgi:hypothetical protein